jgi:transcriptional regulator with XRE-family HTH domain
MDHSNQYERSESIDVIARTLRERRKLLRLTQEDVAAAASVSPKLVGMVESGKPSVQLDGVQKILHVLGLTLTLTESS